MLGIINSVWGFGSVAVIAITIIILAFRKVRVKASKSGFETIVDGAKCEPIIPKEYAQQVYMLTIEAIRHNDFMRSIWPECLRRQLSIYKEHELSLITMISGEFETIGRNLGLTEEIIDYESNNFRSALVLAFMEVEKKVKNSFINNHFYLIDGQKWDLYVNAKCKMIQDTLTFELNNYWKSPHISHSSLKSIGEANMKIFRGVIIDIYERSRDLSSESYKMLLNEDKRYKSYLAITIGIEPTNTISRMSVFENTNLD